MKRILFSMAVFFAATFSSEVALAQSTQAGQSVQHGVASAEGIAFVQLTLEQTIAKAKAEGKYVFIDVYTDWCGPCKMMSEQIFPLKALGDYFNPKYVSLQLNGEKNEDGKALVQKYKISAYPTFIILDGNGNMIHLFAGGVLSVAFIDKVEESFNPDLALGNLEKLYQSGDRSKKTMSAYIKAKINSYTGNVKPMLDKFVDSLKPEELICKECLFIFDDLAQLGSPRADFYVENLDKFRAAVGREKADTVLKKKFEAYYASVLGNQRVKNADEIKKINDKLASLNLSKTDILTAYQVTIKAVMDKTGGEEIVKAAKAASTKVHSNETDVFLYYAIPAAFSILTPQQVDELVALVKSPNVRPKIDSNLKRLRDAAAKAEAAKAAAAAAANGTPAPTPATK